MSNHAIHAVFAYIKGLKMIYFALASDGLFYNLGDHGDFEAANDTAENLKIETIWLFGEDEAINAANFIQTQIEETRGTWGEL